MPKFHEVSVYMCSRSMSRMGLFWQGSLCKCEQLYHILSVVKSEKSAYCLPMSHARSTLKCMFRQMYLLKETDKDLSCCKFLSCSLQEGFGLRTSSLVSFSSASKYDINCLSHTGSSLFTQAPSLKWSWLKRDTMQIIGFLVDADENLAARLLHLPK